MNQEIDDFDLHLYIHHLGKKQSIGMPQGSSLCELQQKLELITHVPVSGQKLVHRGRDLVKLDPDMLLEDCRLKDNDTIMVLGRPVDPESDELVVRIVEVDSGVDELVASLDVIQRDSDELKKGYLDGEMLLQTRARLQRRVTAVNEELMRRLERLDSISVAEASEEAKRRRKDVATRINQHMDRAEQLTESLSSTHS